MLRMSNVLSLHDFAARKRTGDRLENRITTELRARNWFPDTLGIERLHPAIAATLRHIDTPLRNLPDIIAANGTDAVTIDGKAAMTASSSHYNISRRSLAGLRAFAAWTDLPVYCVFDDLQVLTPAEVMQTAGVGRLSAAGAYVRVPRGSGRAFDEVFGARSGVASQRLRLVA